MKGSTYNTETIDAAGYEPQIFSDSRPAVTDTPHLAGNGFAHKWGLHPGIALLTLVVDTMLFGGELASSGLLYPVSIAVSIVLGIIAFLWQRKYYGDDNEAAFMKALTLAMLTAIPTPLPAALYVPAGVLGFFNKGER